jgi:hypothetical protein
LYKGYSLWQFRIGLHCTLVRSPPPSPSHPDLLFAPLHAITRGFTVLFCISIWSPSTIYPHLNPLHSTPPFHKHIRTVLILQSCLLLLFPKSIFKGISWYILAVATYYFGQFNPFHYSTLPLPSQPSLFNSFQYISLCPLFVQMKCISILLTLSFSFLFPPLLSSIEWFHYYKHCTYAPIIV